eukprot:gnl/Dysnectes_brevis/5453_a7849_467.p1 GENE.gnl/Dysnectes_brevis/5453_a7849_467~~gnl/Dysnectes_brevis/5453_a7849_467.p1  ORF type:complete len:573 (-),score=83.77 gnl/Dysnectes_brevis/5453_a7849_467:27-1745(-)
MESPQSSKLSGQTKRFTGDILDGPERRPQVAQMATRSGSAKQTPSRSIPSPMLIMSSQRSPRAPTHHLRVSHAMDIDESSEWSMSVTETPFMDTTSPPILMVDGREPPQSPADPPSSEGTRTRGPPSYPLEASTGSRLIQGEAAPTGRDCQASLHALPTLPAQTPLPVSFLPLTRHKMPGRRAATLFGSSSPAFAVRQTIEKAHAGPIWAMARSPSGQFLATAGRDRIVRVWHVSAPALRRNTPTEDNSMPAIISSPPLRSYEGHTSEVLALSWSRNNSFLLSASLDGDVRLWHPIRAHCLGIFSHRAPVATVKFHPSDDRVFFSAATDKRLRRWHVPQRSVLTVDCGEHITCLDCVTQTQGTVAVTRIVTGSYCGQVSIRTDDELELVSRFSVHSSRGKRRAPHKITGLVAAPGGQELLVSTADSRMRLYSISSSDMLAKFRGHANRGEHSQAVPSFLPSLSAPASGLRCVPTLVCVPSDDGRVFLYDNALLSSPKPRRRMTPGIRQLLGVRPSRDDVSSAVYMKLFDTACTSLVIIPRGSFSGSVGERSLQPGFVLIAADSTGQIKIIAH